MFHPHVFKTPEVAAQRTLSTVPFAGDLVDLTGPTTLEEKESFLENVAEDLWYPMTGWWLTAYPSEKYEFVNWNDEIPNIWKFQATNQMIMADGSAPPS